MPGPTLYLNVSQALRAREADKSALEARICRLTRIILHSTRLPRIEPDRPRLRASASRNAVPETAEVGSTIGFRVEGAVLDPINTF